MGVRDFTEYTTNPFAIPNIREKTFNKKGRAIKLYDPNGGEMMNMVEASGEYTALHDDAKYIKLFSGSVSIIADLGIRGVALLCYIIGNLKPGSEIIELSRKVITMDDRYKTLRGGGYYIGLTDLLSHGIIARVSGASEMYYINANVLFNGDRKRIFKEAIKSTNNGKEE